jgi:heme oxygenase (biliverdin-producing, ferredoxin)
VPADTKIAAVTSPPPAPESHATPAPQSLPEALRRATADVHLEAERSPFVGTLLSGQIEPEAYLRWLVALHGLYAALEQGLLAQRSTSSAPTRPHLPEGIFRAKALQDDIAYWCGHLGCEAPAAGPAAAAYAEHLRTLAREAPARLLAHAYVRYLGDLSGGRLMQKGLKHLGGQGTLDDPPLPHPGMAFFRYPEGESLSGLREQVRAVLAAEGNALPDWQGVLDEAVDAFGRHRGLMDEVDAAAPGETLPRAAVNAAA